MIEFGKTLKEAREAKGLSISQIAEMTRMMHTIVEGLENEDFSRIVAPIYGRGFVKLYCEAVGLEPKPLIAEFMEIISGNRDLTIRDRAPVTAEVPPQAKSPIQNVASVPQDTPAEPPVSTPTDSQPSLFDTTAEVHSSTRPQEDRADTKPESKPLPRFAPPLHRRLSPIPPPLGRWALLVLAAAAVAFLLGLGIRSLYRLTTRPARETAQVSLQGEQTQAELKVAAERPPVASSAKTPRTPQKIPELFID